MSMSRLDQLYRRLLLTKFFTKGWGKPDNLKRLFAFRKILSNREQCQHLVASDYPINIDKEYRDGDCRILEGHFKSPFIDHLPGIMPPEVETASFQMVLPLQWRDPDLKPVCIHLAGTGDHFYWRRRLLTARPLLKESGIASIMLENPYYGSRKPKHQLRSSLHNVSDLFVMGGALVLESLALLHWCEREGWGPLGLSGISMGGHMASGAATLWPKPISVVPILSWTTASVIFTEMASLAATNWTKPIALVPCLSWSTASCVFTQGVMSGAIPWETLQAQFFENSVYQKEIRKLIHSPEDKRRQAYDMGQEFVKSYSDNIEKLESIHKCQQKKDVSSPSKVKQESQTSVSKDTSNVVNSGTTDLVMNLAPGCDNANNNGHINHEEAGLSPENQEDASLSREEYIAHIENQPKSFNQNNNIAPETEVGKKVTPVSPTISSFPSSSTSKPPPPLPSSQISPPAFPAASSKKEEKLTIKQKQPKKETQPLTLSYAKTKEFQQLKTKQTTPEASTLSLKHALAKSRLTIFRSTPSSDLSNSEKLKGLQHEALDFMRGVMDECTHLGNFSVPVDPELIIIVSAKQDAYVPKGGVLGLDQLWPGCQVRYVDQGHVAAVVLHQSVFRKAITDAFDLQVKKYYRNPGNQPNGYQSSSIKSYR